MTKLKVYLAIPYTYTGFFRFIKPIVKFIMYNRFKKANMVCAYLLIRGYNVFSPITHSHPLVKWIPSRKNTHKFWLDIDYQWIDVCDELWVVCAKGWDKSKGVIEEINYARNNGKIVRFLKPNGKGCLYGTAILRG